MKFPIKIVFDFDEQLYLVIVSGIPTLTGRGETEEEAMADFYKNYDLFKIKEYLE